jgi:hypothetical protein
LHEYGFRKKILTYVKDEMSNINVMIRVIKLWVMSVWVLEESFQSICFGHAFSKPCQYVITNEKVYKNL